MSNWSVQEAKSRFSELIDESLAKGPQVVTRHGQATAVVVSWTQWQSVTAKNQRSLKSVLLEPGTPELELVIPPRGSLRLRSLRVDDLAV
jgi:antitoxin Phd